MSSCERACDAKRRVVVTGMGSVTSLGIGVESLWKGIVESRSGIRRIRQFESDDFPVNIGSEVDIDQVPVDGLPELRKMMSRSVRFGICALEEAWKDAGLQDDAVDPYRSGLCIGASNFPVLEGDIARPDYLLDGDTYHGDHYLEVCRQMPELLAQRDLGNVSVLLSLRHPIRAVSMIVQTACASATQAIGEAFNLIRSGRCDLMVTGGTDSMLSAMCVTGFTLLGVTSFWRGDPGRACRPFDRKRDGLVLGEGAGIFLLEELEHARKRNARIYAEVIGYGSSCDGYRFTDSHPEALGPIQCMKAALADAGLTPRDLDYINAHGTATPQNDRIETKAIKAVLGECAYATPVSSTKSQLGHLICASGAVETIVLIMAMRHSLLPPTINLENPDPDCDLDYVPNEGRRSSIEHALSNSFGFGGQNGSIVVRRWPRDEGGPLSEDETFSEGRVH